MAAKGLIDTGAIIAFLSRDDRWHQRSVDAMASLHLPLATSAAVLTELFHLIGRFPLQRAVVWDFLRSDTITVLPIDDADLPELEALMDRYADRAMDFADATLVRLAEREGLTTIFTIDHDDFETYRIGARRRFRIVPAR